MWTSGGSTSYNNSNNNFNNYSAFNTSVSTMQWNDGGGNGIGSTGNNGGYHTLLEPRINFFPQSEQQGFRDHEYDDNFNNSQLLIEFPQHFFGVHPTAVYENFAGPLSVEMESYNISAWGGIQQNISMKNNIGSPSGQNKEKPVIAIADKLK